MNPLTTPSARFNSPRQLKYNLAPAFNASQPSAMPRHAVTTTSKDSVHFGSAPRAQYELFNSGSGHFQGIRINNTPYYAYMSQPEVSERYPDESEKTLEYDLYASPSTEPDPVGKITYQYEHPRDGQGWGSYQLGNSSPWISLVKQ